MVKGNYSLSNNHPFSKLKCLTDERMEELKPQFLSGDKEVIEQVIKGYTRLAISIAGKYSRMNPNKASDFVSEALVALVNAVNSILEGRMLDGNIPKFLIAKIRAHLSNFVRDDKLFGVPSRTSRFKKKQGLNSVEIRQHVFCEKVVGNPKMNYSDGSKVRELLDIFAQAAKTSLQKKIVAFRLEGKTEQEIADELGYSQATIHNGLAIIRKRAKELMVD